ncbi:MAG: putative peptidoglycan endopeptidase LytE precursor [bacterium ADurb.Bin429]|nr:MAG: putative peptidoglycan endopeptidase LytE precursor [bacterium ADurb.Bin429]
MSRTVFRRALPALIGMVLMLWTSAAVAEVVYTVQPGDTLAKLSQRFAIPMSRLIELNGIRNPDVMYVGTQLKLSDAPPVTAKPPATAPAKASPPMSSRELQAARAKHVASQRKSATGATILAAARSFAGTPYRWGGASSRGVDCSGLVVRAMAKQGKAVPHHSAALYKLGQPVSRAALQPGDLVFFNTNGRGISHVGIWAGGNSFIHASSSQRKVVTTQFTGYYAQRYVGARRLP